MCYNFQSARTGRCDVPVFEQHAAAEGGRHLFAYQGVSVLVLLAVLRLNRYHRWER